MRDVVNTGWAEEEEEEEEVFAFKGLMAINIQLYQVRLLIRTVFQLESFQEN